MQFRDLQTQYKALKPGIDKAISDVLGGGQFIGGETVSQLEKELADYTHVRHCISCANGTDALELVLMAWDIGSGDAVFVPDFTFFATAEVVSLLGATPIFVDVDKDTFNISPQELERQIKRVLKGEIGKHLTPKAIIPVDLFGLPANYPEIESIAKKYNLLVLEDGAQGFGGSINAKRSCSFGDAATTSFFPVKPLGCYGDGGAIFTNNDALADKLRSLKVHGKGTDKYDNVQIGINSRLDTLQAAILLVKLKAFADYELDDINKIAGEYTRRLTGAVKTPIVPEGYCSSRAQYTVTFDSRESRDAAAAYLKEQGIPAMIYYPKPIHKQTAYAKTEQANDSFPVTEKLCECVLSLPIHPYMTDEEIDRVTKQIISKR